MTRALVVSGANAAASVLIVVVARASAGTPRPALILAGLLPVGVLLTLAWSLRDLDRYQPGEPERRSALGALVLGIVPLLVLAVLIQVLGVEVPWRFWQAAEPR